MTRCVVNLHSSLPRNEFPQQSHRSSREHLHAGPVGCQGAPSHFCFVALLPHALCLTLSTHLKPSGRHQQSVSALRTGFFSSCHRDNFATLTAPYLSSLSFTAKMSCLITLKWRPKCTRPPTTNPGALPAPSCRRLLRVPTTSASPPSFVSFVPRGFSYNFG